MHLRYDSEADAIFLRYGVLTVGKPADGASTTPASLISTTPAVS